MTTMQGYLKKKSPRAQGSNKVVDSWQKRYFVLANNQLKYFKTEKDAASSSAEPLKMISLAHVQQAAPNPKHADMFMIDLGSDRKVKLQAASVVPHADKERAPGGPGAAPTHRSPPAHATLLQPGSAGALAAGTPSCHVQVCGMMPPPMYSSGLPHTNTVPTEVARSGTPA